jgi:hypothetical protein
LAEILEKPMSDLQYPAWQRPLQDAVNEPRPAKAPGKSIDRRVRDIHSQQELATSRDGVRESEAIREACKQLLKIQTQRLKWPATDGMLSDCAE